MESPQLILINLTIPLINPVSYRRSNIGELSCFRRISLTSGDMVSLSCGLQLCKADGQRQNSAIQGFFLNISPPPSEEFPLEFVTMTMYCSGDMTMAERIYIFLPATEVFVHMRKQSHTYGINVFPNAQGMFNYLQMYQKYIQKMTLPCNYQCIMKLTQQSLMA